MAEKGNEPYILLGIYEKLYFEKHGKKPRVNKYRDKWAMKDVIDTVGYYRALDLINYYFNINRPDHPLLFFLNNFDKMDQVSKELEKDKAKRKALREATKRLVEGVEE